MKIFGINLVQNSLYINNNSKQYQSKPIINNGPSTDCFVKSTSFTGGSDPYAREFELKFPKRFFKKILWEGVPDPYSDRMLIPADKLEEYKDLGVFNKRSSVAIKALKPYKDDMFPIEKSVYVILENLAKKHSNLNLQELLQLRYKHAEQTLINQQAKVLNKIGILGRDLPKVEYLALRKIINESFDKIFLPEPTPEERFRRKSFIKELRQLKISDETVKQKLLKEAEKLPTSSTSVEAFIVKYSQPYKVVINKNNGKEVKIPRTSEDIAIRLLMPSCGTDDHIYPQTKFNKEAKAMVNGEDWAQDLSTSRVTILSSRRMNELKSDTLLDDFANKYDKTILTERFQKHIEALLEIADKWSKNGRFQDAAMLYDYIDALKNELELRSKSVKLFVSDYSQKSDEIHKRARISQEKQRQKKEIKTQRRQARADNNHKGIEEGKQNRKMQKHLARYS